MFVCFFNLSSRKLSVNSVSRFLLLFGVFFFHNKRLFVSQNSENHRLTEFWAKQIVPDCTNFLMGGGGGDAPDLLCTMHGGGGMHAPDLLCRMYIFGIVQVSILLWSVATPVSLVLAERCGQSAMSLAHRTSLLKKSSWHSGKSSWPLCQGVSTRIWP